MVNEHEGKPLFTGKRKKKAFIANKIENNNRDPFCFLYILFLNNFFRDKWDIYDLIISQCGSKDLFFFFLRTWWKVPSSNKGKARKEREILSLFIWSILQPALPFGFFKLWYYAKPNTNLAILFSLEIVLKDNYSLMTWNFKILEKFNWGSKCYHSEAVCTYASSVNLNLTAVSFITSFCKSQQSVHGDSQINHRFPLKDLTWGFIFLSRIFQNIY